MDAAVYVEETCYGLPFGFLQEWYIPELAITTQRFLVPVFLINWGIIFLGVLLSAVALEKIEERRKEK